MVLKNDRVDMLDKFPSRGEQVIVTKNMCDFNKHMNVVYYQHIFEDGCADFYQSMGFTKEYFKQGYSSFTLEANIRYLKEMREGDYATPHYRLIKISEKLIHYAGIIADHLGNVSSFSEHILAHVDMVLRKTSPMPSYLRDNLENMLAEHRAAGDIAFDLKLGIK